MTKALLHLIALLGQTPVRRTRSGLSTEGHNAVIRFGEFGENLREASPGLLDKFARWPVPHSAKGEQKSDATKTANGFTLPFSAASGDAFWRKMRGYPLYVWKPKAKTSPIGTIRGAPSPALRAATQAHA
jgi:hypothetical protein